MQQTIIDVPDKTMTDVADRVVTLLEQLAHTLGITVDHLWAVLIQQQYVNSIVLFSVSAIIFLVWLTASLLLRKRMQELSTTIKPSCEVSPKVFWVSVYWVSTAFVLSIILCTFFQAVKLYYNPQYYALQEVLEVFHK